MTFKIPFHFKLKIIQKNDSKIFDGINFSSICYIDLIYCGKSILKETTDRDSFIYFNELKESTVQSGKYLIFTSVIGVADSAGWERIEVIHFNEAILWEVYRDNTYSYFLFNKKEYKEEVIMIERQINNTQEVLEPIHVIFPEEI